MGQPAPARIGDLVRVRVTRCAPHLNGCFCELGASQSVFVTFASLNAAQKTRVLAGAYLTGLVIQEARGKKLPKVRLIPEYYAGCVLIKLDGTIFCSKTRNPQVRFTSVKSLDDKTRERVALLEEDITSLACSAGLTGEVTVIFLGASESSSNELIYTRVKRAFTQIAEVHTAHVGRAFVGFIDRGSAQSTDYKRAEHPQESEENVQQLVDSDTSLKGEVFQPQAHESVRIALLSGGSCVIEKTEALWAIDVNSGVAKGSDQKSVHHKVNKEALDALIEHIVTHDLTGLFALDFCGHPSQEDFDLYLREISLNLSQNHKIFVGGEVRLGTALFARGLK